MRQKIKDRMRALKMEIREHKSSFIVYVTLRALVILVMILQIFNRNYEGVFYCILTLILLMIPSFIQMELKIELPTTLEIFILIFIFCGGDTGRNRFLLYKGSELGYDAPHDQWIPCGGDRISLVDILNRNEKVKVQLSPLFMAVVAFCFSMTIGVMWEFWECGMDLFLGMDMQKDTIVHSISTVMLDRPEESGSAY